MKTQAYKCHRCGRHYADTPIVSHNISFSQVTHNRVCNAPKCPGNGYMGLAVPIDKDLHEYAKTIGQPNTPGPPRELGLCIFLMDASGSMGDPAFSDVKQPSTLELPKSEKDSPCEGEGLMSKREMMAGTVADSIFSLKKIEKNGYAYIAIILYDDDIKYLLLQSVKDIVATYKEGKELARYLLKTMKEDMGGGTDINKALACAHSLKKEFIDGNINAFSFGKFETYSQTDNFIFDVFSGKRLEKPYSEVTPNVRVLLYTDGDHQPNYGILESPFKHENPDLLIGVYVGDPSDQGNRELKSILKYCPRHGQQQYLSVNRIDDMNNLYGIFLMATGASGFCPKCIRLTKKGDTPRLSSARR
jgi:hypothetical protein